MKKELAGYAYLTVIMALIIITALSGCSVTSDVMLKSALAHYFVAHPNEAAEVNKAENIVLAADVFDNTGVTLAEIEKQFLASIKGRDMLQEDGVA